MRVNTPRRLKLPRKTRLGFLIEHRSCFFENDPIFHIGEADKSGLPVEEIAGIFGKVVESIERDVKRCRGIDRMIDSEPGLREWLIENERGETFD